MGVYKKNTDQQILLGQMVNILDSAGHEGLSQLLHFTTIA